MKDTQLDKMSLKELVDLRAVALVAALPVALLVDCIAFRRVHHDPATRESEVVPPVDDGADEVEGGEGDDQRDGVGEVVERVRDQGEAAGEDAAYDALFAYYGVRRVKSPDQTAVGPTAAATAGQHSSYPPQRQPEVV